MRSIVMILVFTFTVPALAEDIAGRASVIDGDTIEIHGKRIRLFGIDAPEGAQTCQDDAGRSHRCGQTRYTGIARSRA